MSFDPTSGDFRLDYVADHAISAPTVIFVPVQIHYPTGYCAKVSGGSVVSRPARELLLVRNGSAAAVRVTVTAGSCP
jgi:endoglycosylceramidase